MSNRCRWCEEYFIQSPRQTIKLCSKCTKIYKTGNYCHPIQTRLRSYKTNPKPIFTHYSPLETNFLQILEVSSKLNSMNTFTPYFKKILMSPFNHISPLQLYHFLVSSNIWLLEKDATLLLHRFNGPFKWKYEHAITCRIIDKWNMKGKDYSIGICYYRNSNPYPTKLSDIKYPLGKVHQISDLVI
jgi:hypothetical protein